MNKLIAILLFFSLCISLRAQQQSISSDENAENLRSAAEALGASKSKMERPNPLEDRLGWLIVFVGDSEEAPSEQLDKVLFQIQSDLGGMEVPYYIKFPDERRKFLLELGNEDSSSVLISGVMLTEMSRGRFLGELVSMAKERITSRTGFQFTRSPPLKVSQ